MNIDEIPGWFPQGHRTILRDLIEHHECKTGIEIGCFLGLSTVWLAQHLHKLTCVDTWEEIAQEPADNNLVTTLRRMGCPRDFFHVWWRNVEEFELDHKVLAVRGRSDEVHGQITDADIVYIDGDHSLEGCRRDIELYLPKARRVICGDDYAERLGFGVIEAVEELLPGALNCGGFWWYVKE